EVDEVEKRVAGRAKRLEDMEKHKKWNWENMCHVVEERTVISAQGKLDAKDTTKTSELPAELQRAPPAAGPSTPADEVQGYAAFVEKYDKLLEEFSDLTLFEDTETMLLREGDVLFNEHAGSYLLLSCLEDEMNGRRKRMRQVARQSQILTNVAELAMSMKRPPQDVVRPFFRRIQEPEHLNNFNDAVESFAKRVQDRAVEKRKEMEAEQRTKTIETEDGVPLSREERLGPAGLDPMEVFETLPLAMQEAFESRDMAKLETALSALPVAEAKYHLKRCADSGLWVPGGGAKGDDNGTDGGDKGGDDERVAGEEGVMPMT
ncbi:unnamed protein product, partial [Phaeothamnion confervicola]